MCKHILNAQVSIRSPCCKKWFDCAQCHADAETHPLMKSTEMIFACKKCKKCFRKNAERFEEADEYCPHCDNHFVLEAVEPKAMLVAEGDDARMDNRMVKASDERAKEGQRKDINIWDLGEEAERLG